MVGQPQSGIVEENPIGRSLDTFRASFKSTVADRDIPWSPDAIGELELEGKPPYLGPCDCLTYQKTFEL